MTDNIRKMINTGAFVPINVKQIAKAYYRERLQRIYEGIPRDCRQVWTVCYLDKESHKLVAKIPMILRIVAECQ